MDIRDFQILILWGPWRRKAGQISTGKNREAKKKKKKGEKKQTFSISLWTVYFLWWHNKWSLDVKPNLLIHIIQISRKQPDLVSCNLGKTMASNYMFTVNYLLFFLTQVYLFTTKAYLTYRFLPQIHHLPHGQQCFISDSIQLSKDSKTCFLKPASKSPTTSPNPQVHSKTSPLPALPRFSWHSFSLFAAQ